MDFIAIDFETANQKQSPCAIGLVLVENNCVSDEYHTLINPDQSFSQMCVAIHGITKKDVADAPTFPKVWAHLRPFFSRYPVVAHNAPFDKSVLERALQRYRLHALPIVYYDTMNLYRHNFPDAEAYDLKSVCVKLGVRIDRHHNALADAKAAARIMLSIIANKDSDIFPSALGENINPSSYSYHNGGYSSSYKYNNHEEAVTTTENEPVLATTTAHMDVVEEIIFEGSTFVITGVIAGYERSDLENQIQARGGKVTGSVSKKTRYVVTGLQDVSVVKDTEGAKSGKILKAEALRDEGHDIKIIGSDVLLSALQICHP